MSRRGVTATRARDRDPSRGQSSTGAGEPRARDGLTDAERSWLLRQMGGTPRRSPTPFARERSGTGAATITASAEAAPAPEPPRAPARAGAKRERIRKTASGDYSVVFACATRCKDPGGE